MMRRSALRLTRPATHSIDLPLLPKSVSVRFGHPSSAAGDSYSALQAELFSAAQADMFIYRAHIPMPRFSFRASIFLR
jgi:hypothetical protein